MSLTDVATAAQQFLRTYDRALLGKSSAEELYDTIASLVTAAQRYQRLQDFYRDPEGHLPQPRETADEP